MAKIQINEFKGILPKLANDKLPANMAQIAAELKTASLELRAFRRSTGDVALAGNSYKTFFQYFENSNNHWVYTDNIVHWARSPVADDSFERMYYTGEAGVAAVGTITFLDTITDGETVTIGTDTFEYDIAEDGVATGNILVGDSTTTTKELAASTLITAHTTYALDSSYSLTDNLDGTVTVTAVTAGYAGNEIVFSDTGAQVDVDGVGFLGATTSGESSYRAFSNDINSAPWDFTADYYQPGAPIGVAPTLVKTGSGAEVRSYFYSFVSRYGEEGPGSAIAETTDYLSGRVQVNNITLPSDSDFHLLSWVYPNYPKVKVYRTDSTASTALFQEVCEAYWFDISTDYAVGDFVFYGGGGTYDLWECTTIHPAGAWNAGHFTQGEAVALADLGDSPDTYLWKRAETGMTNLRSHPNGFFVASKGKTLYFSEPFAPWAWPSDYEIPIDANIVGLGIFGSTIVVATDANIYTFSGPHPDSLYKQKLAFQPCLSQRAVVETDLGVMFPSAEGFQLVAADSAPSNVTADFFKPEDWANFELDTMHGTWYNKAYYGWYKSVDYEGGIIIDFVNGSITTSNDYHYASHVAVADGIFRTIYPAETISAPGVLYIAKWDSDPIAYRNFWYKSPRYILEKPANFKVAQVIIDTEFYNTVLETIASGNELTTLNQATWDETDWGYQMGGPLNDFIINSQDVNGDDLYSLSDLGVQTYIEFNIYADGVLKFTKQITESTMFKLPRGFKDKKWEVEVKGMIPVKRITIATSTEEIV